MWFTYFCIGYTLNEQKGGIFILCEIYRMAGTCSKTETKINIEISVSKVSGEPESVIATCTGIRDDCHDCPYLLLNEK
jgi:hypothetical protein